MFFISNLFNNQKLKNTMALHLVKVSLTCLLFSLISTPSSSSSSSHKNFQILNVTASLHQAHQVLSPNSTYTHVQQPHPPAHTLSLTLVSRASLSSTTTTTTNYTSLIISRLARDQAHVHSLLSTLSLSLSTHAALESPLISGLKQHNGEYFARIAVGRPAAHLYMIIDTGSDITWLQCKPCLHCYPQSDPIFNPSASSTYAPLTCLSPQCLALDAAACGLLGSCLYQVFYGDASFTVGEFATETISFNSSASVAGVAIGCGHNNGGLFIGAAGLLGLGGGELSLPTQIKATSFSYCLVNRDSNSSSTLDFNSTQPSDSVVAPLIVNPRAAVYRYVGLSGIIVGGEAVRFAPSLFEMGRDGSGGVIVDSGTTVTRLRRDVYELVRDAFRNMTGDVPLAAEFLLFDTCYDFSSRAEVRIPAVSFEFSGGKTVALPPQNYMIPVDSSGKFCFAFAGMAGTLSIIGNVQQQGMRITYDLANKYIAFSPNKC